MKRHRNILYTLVVLLMISNATMYFVLNSEVTDIKSSISENQLELEKADAEIVTYFTKALQESEEALASQQEQFKEEIIELKTTSGDFSDIIEDAVKSVVNIATDKSLGTGFIINSEGYLLTNYHVIEGAERINIITNDRKVLPAQVVWADGFKDVSLLKIQGSYDALKLADSDSLQVGKKVIAIGNPFGLSFTVTEGIISGLDREGPNGLFEYIQTDVSLNPGNSGGPLIDTSGKVVGINNFKVGGAEGIGFALESNSIENSLNELSPEVL